MTSYEELEQQNQELRLENDFLWRWIERLIDEEFDYETFKGVVMNHPGSPWEERARINEAEHG